MITMKTLILYSAVFALAASASIYSGISPKFGFVAQADGKMFFADAAAKTWANANTYCKTMGMQLAEITSTAQADALFSAYNSTTFAGNYWLNARDSGYANQTIWEQSWQSPKDEFLRFRPSRRLLTCLFFVSAAEGGSYTSLVSCTATTVGSLCEFVPPSEE